MTVIIDGKEHWREVDHYDVENRRYMPVLRPREEAIWSHGAFYPTIVETQMVSNEHSGDKCCPMCDMPLFYVRCNRCGYEPA